MNRRAGRAAGSARDPVYADQAAHRRAETGVTPPKRRCRKAAMMKEDRSTPGRGWRPAPCSCTRVCAHGVEEGEFMKPATNSTSSEK